MWTAPSLQDDGKHNLIACVRMSGLLVRSGERWPRWAPRQGAQTYLRPLRAKILFEQPPVRDRSITPSPRSCKFRHQINPVASKFGAPGRLIF